MFKWLANNSEWVFSGIGVFILTAIISVARWLIRKKKRILPQGHPKYDLVKSPALKRVKKAETDRSHIIRARVFELLVPAGYPGELAEIRHVTDALEEEFNLKPDDSLRILIKMKEDGLIFFETINNAYLDPYTRIKLSNLFFAAIE